MSGHRFLIATAVAAALALPSPAFAQKITADPNAPGSRVEAAQPQLDDTDQLLAQKVTLHITRKSVAQILSVLSKQTGVDLRAGVNQQDWQVRDRRMNIYCKDLPLSNLMNSIARVMKFKWSREKTKTGVYAYRLYMDRKTLLDQEAQTAREEERRLKAETERRRKALETYASLANVSDSDLAKLRSENPFKYLVATSGLAKPMSGLFAEAPSLFQALASGQAANLQASSLSPKGQSLLAETWKGLHKIMSFAHTNIDTRTPGEMPSDTDRVTIRINPHLDMMSAVDAPPSLLGIVEISHTDGAKMHLPILEHDSSLGKLFGDMILESMETGGNLSEMEREGAREMGSRISAALTADTKSASPDEPKKDRPDDPALRVKVKTTPDSDKLADVQSALADVTGVAVVSDSFRQRFPRTFPKDKEMELGELLDKIGDSYRYDWDKPGSVIEFRDKKWFAKRAAQIPDAWIEAWRTKLKDTGALDLEDLAQICSLTQEQFDENISEDNVLKRANITGNYYVARDVLKLYGMLTETQRSAVLAEPGMDLSVLSAEQWAQAAKAIGSRRAALTENRDVSLRFSVRREYEEGKLRYYRFLITPGDGSEPIRWLVSAPTFVD